MCSIYFAAALQGSLWIRTLIPIGVRFGINQKTKNCKQIIIIAKSVKYFFFCEHFFNALKDVPGYPISVQGMQEQLHSSIESPILQISRGGLPPDPLRGWCIRHSTFVPAARTVHVRQLKHCIRYFQMLPKTPQSWESFWKEALSVTIFIRYVWTVGQTGGKKYICFRTETDTCGRGLRLRPHESRYFWNCILFWY